MCEVTHDEAARARKAMRELAGRMQRGTLPLSWRPEEGRRAETVSGRSYGTRVSSTTSQALFLAKLVGNTAPNIS